MNLTNISASRALRRAESRGQSKNRRSVAGVAAAFIGLSFVGTAVAQTPTSTSAPAAAVTPPAPPKPETPLVKFYGIIKPAVVVSNGVETFGVQNSNSVTAAAHPVAFTENHRVAFSFQVMQTRFGAFIGGDNPVQGRIEIDFAGTNPGAFQQATPTTQIGPRLRIASLEWKATPELKVGLGQNWDIFSPMNPNTYNLTGALFLAGNSGFQRQQAYAIYTAGSIELALAVGMAGINAGTTFNFWNKSSSPSIVARAAFKNDTTYAGASFLGAFAKLTSPTGAVDPDRQPILVGNIFAEHKIGKGNVRIEGYIGQNGQNAGLLTLAAGRWGTLPGNMEPEGINVAEVGGWFSTSMPAGPIVPHLSVGFAKVLNTSKMTPGYTPATPASEGRAAVPASRSGIGGIEYNLFVDAGFKYPVSVFAIYLDGFFIATRHRLRPVERDAGFKSRRFAGGGELGMIYAF